ncbi:MAG: pilus assembly protein [Acidimicrobiia bacterium]|nr:pilus assembly protein [Acidimicrobiia bacterium]
MGKAAGERARRRRPDDRGAALVEFALVLPILALIIFGTIEFGWAFSQNLDVRHGAREAARLAVVDFDDGDTATTAEEGIANTACSRMDSSQATTITVSAPSGLSVGDYLEVTVTRQHAALTGFVDFALPSSLASKVQMRLEQDASWTASTWSRTCP